MSYSIASELDKSKLSANVLVKVSFKLSVITATPFRE